MLLSEKLKYCRERLGITQQQLAEKSGIHLSSIKRYETDKRYPEYDQMLQLAHALNISPNALLEFNSFNFRFETVGDFLSIIIFLINSNFLYIDGQRDNMDEIVNDSFSLKFNQPILGNILMFNTLLAKDKNTKNNIDMISLSISDKSIRNYLIKWDKIRYKYREMSTDENISADTKKALEELLSMLKKIELEMQSIQINLTSDHGGLSVKTPPNIHLE